MIWTDPLIGAGAGTYLDDLLGLAGGQNIVWERTGSYPRLNWEHVVDRAPEVILLADHREDSGRGRDRERRHAGGVARVACGSGDPDGARPRRSE